MGKGKTAALAHLNKDKVLKKVINKSDKIVVRKDLDLYNSLMRAIVGQQLSIKAAATIWERFLDLFEARYPFPEEILAMEDRVLRAAGLSYQKASYLKNIATFSKEKTLDYEKLRRWSDEKLIEYLTEIKGVGKWTVEMILMFSLDRKDVLPLDDLGIQNGMIRLYGIKHKNKKDLYKKMETLAECWRPHRSLACMYLWRYKDNPPLKK